MFHYLPPSGQPERGWRTDRSPKGLSWTGEPPFSEGVGLNNWSSLKGGRETAVIHRARLKSGGAWGAEAEECDRCRGRWAKEKFPQTSTPKL